MLTIALSKILKLKKLLKVTILLSIAFIFQGSSLWLLWLAWSMLIVSACYAFLGSDGFQKNINGKVSFSVYWMLLPYLIAARFNSYLWTRNTPAANLISDKLFLGRFPSSAEIKLSHYSTIIDLSAEFNAPNTTSNWISIPCLDLVMPNRDSLQSAALRIEQSIQHGKVLVCCALGYTRSTLAVISWLVITRRVSSVDDAIILIRNERPNVVLNEVYIKKIKHILKNDIIQ